MTPLEKAPVRKRGGSLNQVKRRSEITEFHECGCKYAELPKLIKGYNDVIAYNNAVAQCGFTDIYVHLVSGRIIAERTDL